MIWCHIYFICLHHGKSVLYIKKKSIAVFKLLNVNYNDIKDYIKIISYDFRQNSYDIYKSLIIDRIIELFNKAQAKFRIKQFLLKYIIWHPDSSYIKRYISTIYSNYKH